MLTALLTLTLIASPYPGEAPAALPFFGGAADGPDAAGYVIVPAETTGYAYIKDDGRQGVVRGELTYGYLEWAKYWTYYAGFLIFELDVIPERAVVASADMDYFQYRSTSGDESVPFDVRTFSYEKHLGGMEMLRRVESGLRVSDTVLSREGWNRVTLWPSGIAAVDSCRRQGDFLALGMARIFYLYYLDCRGYAYGHDAVPEYLPYLRIGYLWIYPDVGTAMLIEPADTVVTGVAITPRALVRNHSADTLSFPVRFTIGTGYTSETTMTLEPGTEDMVRFAPWIPQDTGRFEVKCSTMLAGDEDPANDRLTDTVVVINPGGIGDSPMPVSATRFALYPNPARNRVWLESPESSTLYGPDGRRVALLQPGENDIRYLSPGVYFVRRQDTGESGRLVLVE